MRFVFLPIVAAIAIGCAGQQPQSASPATAAADTPAKSASAPAPKRLPEGPISLEFGWPDGLKADVVSTSIKAQSIGPQSRTQDLTSTYVMTARRTATGGISVDFDQFAVQDPGSADSSAAIANLLAYRPGFAVDERGQLAEIHGMEVLQDLLETAKREAELGPQSMQQGFQIVAQTVTNENYLKTRAGAEWTNLIGTWIDQTLTPGQTKKTREESATSGVLDAAIATDVQTSIAHIEGCSRIGASKCVRLRVSKQPDPDKMREAIRPSLGKLLGVEDWGPEGPPKVLSVIATSQLIVDTEPDTLVPHRVEVLRVFSLELTQKDTPFEVRDSNRTTTTYTYQ